MILFFYIYDYLAYFWCAPSLDVQGCDLSNAFYKQQIDTAHIA